MHFLSYLVQYRLDLAAFVIAAGLGVYFCRKIVRRRRPDESLPRHASWIVAALVLAGSAVAEWSAAQRREFLISVFSNFGSTYAAELQKLGHAKLDRSTPPDDPTYLALIAAEKNWLRANPLVADIYTFRLGDDRNAYFLVDSETDYDRNGVFDGEREQRTPIGEVYQETPDNFRNALKGIASFDKTIQTDRWGTWVTSATPILDGNGRVEAAVGIDYTATEWLQTIATTRAVSLAAALVVVAIFVTNITLISLMRAEIRERRDAQAELQRAKEAADDASHAKSEFLAVMSHEIRTPLTAVMGFASVLSETSLDPTQQRYVNTIVSAGDRLVALLNDILDLTKMEEGKLTLENFSFSPRLLIDEVVDLMTACSMEKGLNLQVENLTADDLAVEGDPSRMRQILLNLVSNAVKFTDRGSVTVRATWQAPAKPSDKGRLTIEVVDTGIGIHADRMGSLFQTFTQVHASTRRYNGSGLGLAICKRLAELMGGSISVESAFGSGSKFTISVPCKAANSAAVAHLGLGTSQTGGVALLRPERVLVVDDQSINRELLKLMLRRLGYVAESAESGAEALNMLKQNSYALVFMDLEMPGMDGFSATRNIRAAESNGHRVPVVAVTATTVKGTREKCIDAGMDEYLTKPVYVPALKSTLEAMLCAPTPAA